MIPVYSYQILNVSSIVSWLRHVERKESDVSFRFINKLCAGDTVMLTGAPPCLVSQLHAMSHHATDVKIEIFYERGH